ncbi:hypothetical protein HY310_03750 [Candidatus Microgenomates bacterium]|nr:hypothetical protein [Candidatus Microgenomates bacterium]
MRTATKSVKEVTYKIVFPWGGTTKIGPGISNVPTSHHGVPAKNFSKALEKASREASEAGVFESD